MLICAGARAPGMASASLSSRRPGLSERDAIRRHSADRLHGATQSERFSPRLESEHVAVAARGYQNPITPRKRLFNCGLRLGENGTFRHIDRFNSTKLTYDAIPLFIDDLTFPVRIHCLRRWPS